MKPIAEVAQSLGLDPEHILPYGHHKAKVSLEAVRDGGRRGKLIVVTGMTPTRAGEGKTTTTVGLVQALSRLGYRAVGTIREPSLGPIFGIKGGGTGGGKARVVPEDEINVHFTGDAHAVASAHNLLAALTDNAAYRGLVEGLAPDGITWRRVTDMEDRALRSIVTGLGGRANAPLRETGFDIVTASEIMAILALASDLQDLRSRLARVVVGFTQDGRPVTALEVGAVGSMMALLRYALLPNLVQTCEGQPVFVHTGPFGNIAHGCSSVVADRLALSYADYVVTEAGFGADLGFEKFMHIKARSSGLEPAAAVIVASVRALKSHGGVRARDLERPDVGAVEAGLANLEQMINIVRSFGVPPVVALNRFPTDTAEEVKAALRGATDAGACAAVESRVFAEGGVGGVELAEAVVEAARPGSRIRFLYDLEAPLEEKVRILATQVYGAAEVAWSPAARRQLRTYQELGWSTMPICMAKTHLSISHNPRLKGRPTSYTFEVTDVRASPGAGFIYPISGSIMTMPGLPSSPRSLDVDEAGNIVGL